MDFVLELCGCTVSRQNRGRENLNELKWHLGKIEHKRRLLLLHFLCFIILLKFNDKFTKKPYNTPVYLFSTWLNQFLTIRTSLNAGHWSTQTFRNIILVQMAHCLYKSFILCKLLFLLGCLQYFCISFKFHIRKRSNLFESICRFFAAPSSSSDRVQLFANGFHQPEWALWFLRTSFCVVNLLTKKQKYALVIRTRKRTLWDLMSI